MPITRSQTGALPKSSPPSRPLHSAPSTHRISKSNSKSRPSQPSKPAAPKTRQPIVRQPLSSTRFGLIQERHTDSLYALVIQAILWNQTAGRAARPVLESILNRYPDPYALAKASLADLTDLLYPIGLHNQRAKRLIKLAEAWIEAPPCKERRYVRRDYPKKGDGRVAKVGEVLDEADEREGWEIAHLPGMGPYALDSFRIFYRDKLRGLEDKEGLEPEWKRVQATDKDLRAWLIWKWENDGLVWDPAAGRVVRRVDKSTAK